jgi:hypothetical protein
MAQRSSTAAKSSGLGRQTKARGRRSSPPTVRKLAQPGETIEERAESIVKKRYPDAADITQLETRQFIDGRLVIFSFRWVDEDDEDDEELIYIYFDEVESDFPPRVCEMQDELVSLVNDLQHRASNRFSQRCLDYVFREGGAAVVIALVLVSVLAYSVVYEKKIDSKFWNVFLLVVGFYFGSNVPQKKSK